MSTVLDALKKLQSERDRGGGSARRAFHEDVVDGGPPGPERKRWVIRLISLGILVTAGAAAGYLFLGTGDELLPLLTSRASSAEAGAEQGGTPGRAPLPAAQSRRGRAASTPRPDPGIGLTLEERVAKQSEEVIARMQRNLGKRAEARKARQRAAQARTSSAASALAAKQKQTPVGRPAGRPPEAAPQDGPAAPRPVVQAERTDPVRASAEGDTLGEAGDWEAGAGSVHMAAPPPDSASPRPEPARAAAPTPAPEPTPPMESRPVSREPSRPTARLEPKPTELLDAPLASDLPFPEVSLEAVRWHPDAERREARLMVDNRRPVDVREGDIVAGVAVRRIHPGAVELTVGTSRMLVRIGE